MSSPALATRADEFRAALEPLLPQGSITADEAEAWAVDGVEPALVVEPRSEEDLAAVLEEADASRMATIAIGGGRHLGIGNMPAAYDVAVSLRRLDGIVAYEPADLTVTVQAGVTVRALREVLADRGQQLPLDPPCQDDATVGGLIASNARGPQRHAYGTVRDWLIGVRVVHAGGTVSKAGGRVVKNVAGYEMVKLYCGSLGTLGVVSEATFKLATLPRSEVTVAIRASSPRVAAQIARTAHERGLALTACELLSPPAAYRVSSEPAWCLLARVAGGGAAVERSLRDLQALTAEAGGALDLRDDIDAWRAWSTAMAPAALSLSINVAPAHVAETMEVLDRRFTGAMPLLSATVSAGVIRASLAPGRIRAATLLQHTWDVVARRQGSVFVDAAPPALKREVDVFGPLRPDFAIMKRLKEEFDPSRILAPGRFVGRL
jgi:glycolate oxidase FAD binding subunit